VGSRGSVVPFFEKLKAEGATSLPITDTNMTRFWISLQQGVDFVLKNFSRMHGGEIFVPKIPSVRIPDLARAIAPDLAQHVVGIRPGEKLHEIMCPADDSHLTLEFDQHYVITPTIRFFDRDISFARSADGETGTPVEQGFEYNSGRNDHFLTVDEIVAFNKVAML
jgi:UDP-N-acetylglucosamine 4,6-dehydratase